MASEASRKKAEGFVDGIAGDVSDIYGSDGRGHWVESLAAALDETRAEGVAEGEKRGAVEQVKVDAGNAMLAWMEQTSASLTDQVRGRCAEAGYDLILAALRECCERERGACYREIDDAPPEIRYLIAARGRMRGPEEDK